MREEIIGKIIVHPCACEGDGLRFPCLAIEVIRDNHPSFKTWIDILEHGRHFGSLDDAIQEAKKYEVTKVFSDGTVEKSFGHK